MIPTPAIRRVTRRMLEELDAGWLEVIKVPSRDDRGGYVRVVCQQNAKWYREFCGDYEMRRVGRMKKRSRYKKPRTIIKRCHTRKALEHIAAGHNSTVYSARLLEFIERNGHIVSEHYA